MQEKFIHLVQNYANTYGFTCSITHDIQSAKLEIESLSIHITLKESIASLVVSCGIAPMPEKNKEKVFVELLKLHNCFINAYNCAFGLDGEQKLLTLQTTWSLGELDDAQFELLIGAFMASVVKLLDDIYIDLLEWNSHEFSEKNNDILINMMHMLRI